MANVNRDSIDKYIVENHPFGIEKLAIEARIPASTISRIRLGLIPTSEFKRARLAKTVGVPVEALFPGVKNEKA